MRLFPQLQPMFTGLASGPADPLAVAVAQARRGVDAGLLVWSVSDDRLRAALVLAPEVPLGRATAAFVACAVGAQNAIGAMAPPETAVHLEWSGGVRLNGAHAGALRLIGPGCDPGEVPDWLVVGLDLALVPAIGTEPGRTPDQTALSEEGCGGIDPIELIEAWARHALFWLSDIEDDPAHTALLRTWNGLAWKMGGAVRVPVKGEVLDGVFLGVDEDFGLLLKTGDETRLVPLIAIMEDG